MDSAHRIIDSPMPYLYRFADNDFYQQHKHDRSWGVVGRTVTIIVHSGQICTIDLHLNQRLGLTEKEIEDLARLRVTLSEQLPLSDVIVFGSKGRGDSDLESDLDVLVVLSRSKIHGIRGKISDVVFEINLDLSTNISVVVGSQEWHHGRFSQTPLKKNVAGEGVSIW